MKLVCLVGFTLAVFIATACEEEAQPVRSPTPTPTPTQAPTPHAVDGATLYAGRCALCHGDTGQGYVADHATALNNPVFLEAASDEFLRRSIEHGRPGTPMSAWGAAVGGPLDDEELDAVVKHVRGFADVSPVEVDSVTVMGSAVRAQSYYDVKCKSCHGEQGHGGQFISVANPEFLASASDGYLRHAIREGRPDTPMQAFAGKLADQVIDDLVVLIRSWQVDPVVLAAQQPAWPSGDGAIQNPEGSAPSFPDGGFVSVDAVHTALDNGERMLIADARAPTDYVAEHIAGAVSVPFYESEKYVDKLPADVTIVAYCGCPHAASGALAEALGKRGFTQVKVLDEGYYTWRDRGYSVTTGTLP